MYYRDMKNTIRLANADIEIYAYRRPVAAIYYTAAMQLRIKELAGETRGCRLRTDAYYRGEASGR